MQLKPNSVITNSVVLQPVETLTQALQVRRLRNACREYLTNCQDHIGFFQQLLWYFRTYRPALRDQTYRLFLIFDKHDLPVGYGALALKEDELKVTECVAPEYRGRGFGRMILNHLIDIAAQEKRDLVAEIFTANLRSIALHEKARFRHDSTKSSRGKEIRSYRLAAETFSEVCRTESGSRIVA